MQVSYLTPLALPINGDRKRHLDGSTIDWPPVDDPEVLRSLVGGGMRLSRHPE